MAKIKGDQYLAKTLAGYGVTHFFHTPVIVPETMQEMEKPEYGVQGINAHAEKASAYMADGYARATGKPGVCGCQMIGNSNLSAGLRDAFMAHVPVIALGGGRLIETRFRAPYQEIEDREGYIPVTKFSGTVDHIDRLPDMLRQAFRESVSGRPAPVHLELQGLWGHVVNDMLEDDTTVEERFAQVPPFRPSAESGDVEKALQALYAAEKPVIVAGGGVVLSGAQEEVVEFARLMDIPVATSMNAKGTISEVDPLSVGVVGQYSRECTNRIVNEADLVFYIGSMTGGQVTHHWTIPAQGKKVIQLDIDPHWLGRNYPNIASLCGDAKTVIQQLIAEASPEKNYASWREQVAAYKVDWKNQFEGLRSSGSQPMRPERIMREISNYLPDDAVFVADTGHAGMWSAAFLELTSPDQRFLRAAGSLGWAFPAAIGAKCGVPDRPVFAFTGDGGFYYHLTELETAKRYGINTITIVNNNCALNQEATIWPADEGDTRLFHHWRFDDNNFAKMAENFGCFGIRVYDPAEIPAALEEAQASNLPAVVELMSDVAALAPVGWRPDGAGYGH